jgi:hypothetical protein
MTIARTSGWAVRLMLGRIKRLSQPPASRIPMRSNDGAAASHGMELITVSIMKPKKPLAARNVHVREVAVT